MNKLNLLLLAGAAALASCASEDVINSGDIQAPSAEGQAMSFGMLTGNLSRAGMEADGHTDFGVFAYKGTDMATGLVMQNYRVVYSDTDPGEGKNTTWGDGNNTVNGKSRWYYEGIGSQVLKYWDYSFDNHYFVAYTPYSASNASLTANDAATVNLKSDLKISNAVSFWTMAERDDKEAMWAKAPVAKAAYGTDVALNFDHLNAVVKLAFRSNIPGYTVKLINLVPTTSTVAGISNIQYGVQLTPATEAQKSTAIGWTSGQGAAQPTIDQEYATQADFTVADVFAATPNITTAVNTKSKENLVFNLGETQGAATEVTINNGASAEYTNLGSQFFALPLSDYSSYTTGYTLHVSYVLIPNDGAANTTVYDARVFIPAAACQWAYGKSYLYRFTITTASTGVTDPNQQIYDGGSTTSNYVDPTDPRVPTTDALLPIVFDGVTVADYTTATESDHNIN
ncbi:MAG: hypothetical protein ACI4AM_08970 [Muribaculaceae bacterium]